MKKPIQVLVRFDDDRLIEAVGEDAERVFTAIPADAFFELKHGGDTPASVVAARAAIGQR